MATAAPITVDRDALLQGALRSPDGRQVIVDNGEGLVDDPDALLAAAAGPEVVIEANPLAANPPQISLLSSAIDVTALLGAQYGLHWLNGFQFEPEGGALDLANDFPYWWKCAEPGGFTPEQVAPTTDGPRSPGSAGAGIKQVGDKPANVEVRPIIAYATDPCISTFGMFGRDAEARARRLLEANLPRIIENELWTGARATFALFNNPRLDGTNPTPTTPAGTGAIGYLSALAELEQGITDNATPLRDTGQGVIHANRRLVSLWISEKVVVPDASGRRLRTLMGTVVIPGDGYPGTRSGQAAPTRTDTWAYGTGPVAYARTPARLQVAGPVPGRFFNSDEAMQISRDVQDRKVRAECDFAAFWDATTNIAVHATLTTRLS